MKKKEHLPLIGVGPVIVAPQLLLTAVGIVLSERGYFGFGRIALLKLPFRILGAAAMVFGLYLWVSANYKTKVDRYITANQLATTGVYGIVINPIYSAFLLVCIGAVLLENNWVLFGIPVICWGYMTVLLKKTEEKWLLELYGEEYVQYCKKVNRCIPCFPKERNGRS